MLDDDDPRCVMEIGDEINLGKLWRRIEAAEERILTKLSTIGDQIMATLADLVADDTELEGEVASIITDLEAVQAQLAALQTAGLTPDQQAQVDQVAASLSTLNANITAALPAAPAAPADGSTPPVTPAP